MRGVSHRIAFVVSVPIGMLLVVSGDNARERASALVFAGATYLVSAAAVWLFRT